MIGGYNELTKELLAQGYTAENYPSELVKIAGGSFSRGGKLDNLYGGFEYLPTVERELVFELPCGVIMRASTGFGNSFVAGKEYSAANHRILTHCPKSKAGCESCPARPENLRGYPHNLCAAVKTDRPYIYDGSLEDIRKRKDRECTERLERYLAEHENACRWQTRYDAAEDRIDTKIDLDFCATSCQARGFCKTLNLERGKAKGNIYYDIEIEGRDCTKDGTLFEGDRFHVIHKGFQYFDKPIDLAIAERYAKVKQEDMILRIRYGQLGHLIRSIDVYRAEIGELDLHWEVKNIRVEKKNVRDLEQDLRDIADGLKVTHAIDVQKAQKEAKRIRKEKAEQRKVEKARKDLLTKDLGEYERRKAEKLLGDEYSDILAEKKRSAEAKAEPEAHQINIFEFMEGKT